MTPKENLGPGEFRVSYPATTGSVYGGAGVSGKLFDFGADAPPKK